jgi:hypothetical protein
LLRPSGETNLDPSSTVRPWNVPYMFAQILSKEGPENCVDRRDRVNQDIGQSCRRVFEISRSRKNLARMRSGGLGRW